MIVYHRYSVAQLFIQSRIKGMPLIRALRNLIIRTILASVVRRISRVHITLTMSVYRLGARVVTFQRYLTIRGRNKQVILFRRVPFVVFNSEHWLLWISCRRWLSASREFAIVFVAARSITSDIRRIYTRRTSLVSRRRIRATSGVSFILTRLILRVYFTSPMFQ